MVNKNRWKEMGRCAVEDSTAFSIEHNVDKLLKVINTNCHQSFVDTIA